MKILKKPIIAITLDSDIGKDYSEFPWYALRQDYSNVVTKYGGVPIFLPYELSLIEQYIELIDGLILTGGDFDIDPKYWGEEIKSEKVIIKNKRTEFEWAITKATLNKQIPILGICAGEQLLNVILGGSLIQHIPDTVENCLEHEQPSPKNIPWHKVQVIKNTLIHKIVGITEFSVNSTHHQAVNKLGENIIATAYSPDGVIEAIELTDYPFAIGVQWHPEYETSEEDTKIIKAFLDACRI